MWVAGRGDECTFYRCKVCERAVMVWIISRLVTVVGERMEYVLVCAWSECMSVVLTEFSCVHVPV